MKKRLTAKQAKFVSGIAQGKSGIQSVLNNYDTKDPHVAKVIASENLTKPNIKEALEPFLKKHNITLDTVIAPIGKGLTATKMNQFTGEIDEDINLQIKASLVGMKLLGIGAEAPSLHLHQHLHEQRDKYAL